MRNEHLQDLVSKALRQAWQLGQTYCDQADSEYLSHNKQADVTEARFHQLIEETRAALASPVSLPDPVAFLHTVHEEQYEKVWFTRGNESGGVPVFTEKQVRALLAQAAKEPTK